jgi:hypothetical protein
MKWLGLAIAAVLATRWPSAAWPSRLASQQAAAASTVRHHPVPRVRHPGGYGDRDPARRLVRHRRHHQPRAVFTLLSAQGDAVYAAIVLGIGALAGSGSDPLLTVAAAVVIALVFQPLRQRASRLANRLVYGHRATPYQVLSDFAADMAGQLDLGVALDRMVSLLGGAAGASRVEAWIRVGAELRPGAVWPGDARPSAVVPLNGASGGAAELPSLTPGPGWCRSRHGTTCSARSPEQAAREALTSTEDSLLRHLASAGQPGHAQRPAHRRAAGHDRGAARVPAGWSGPGRRTPPDRAELRRGARQQLIALAIQLGLLAELADDPDLIRQAIPDLKAQLSTALDDLRALARGIYPPLLAEQGLVAGAARAGRPQPGAGRPEAGPGRPLPAGRREHRLLLHPGGAAERGQARPATAVDRPPVRLRRVTGVLGQRRRRGLPGRATATAPACRACPTGWPRTAPLTVRSRPGQGTTITGRLPTSERTAAAGSRGQPGLN